MYQLQITGITHSWTKWDDYETLVEVRKHVKRAVNKGRRSNSIRVVCPDGEILTVDQIIGQ